MTTDPQTINDETAESNIKDPYLERALRHLETPESQPWTKDSRFLLAGRWQMKRYPNIMLSPLELAQVIKIFEESLPDLNLWRRVFQRVESHLKTYRVTGKNIAAINAMNWLTGWCLNETLETAIKEQRIKKGKVR